MLRKKRKMMPFIANMQIFEYTEIIEAKNYKVTQFKMRSSF